MIFLLSRITTFALWLSECLRVFVGWCLDLLPSSVSTPVKFKLAVELRRKTATELDNSIAQLFNTDAIIALLTLLGQARTPEEYYAINFQYTTEVLNQFHATVSKVYHYNTVLPSGWISIYPMARRFAETACRQLQVVQPSSTDLPEMVDEFTSMLLLSSVVPTTPIIAHKPRVDDPTAWA